MTNILTMKQDEQDLKYGFQNQEQRSQYVAPGSLSFVTYGGGGGALPFPPGVDRE